MCSRCTDPQCDAPDGIVMDDTTVPVCQVVPEGVNTTGMTGMTLETLNLMSGFYRASNKSREILECHREDACLGGSKADTYCAKGYTGLCEGFYLPIANVTEVGCGTFEIHGVFLNAFNYCIQ